MVFDSGSSADKRALERLETEKVAWLATVTAEGQPQAFPIWFLWRDGEILVYSDRRARRNANIAANPRVAFHLDTNPDGGDVVVIEGEARIDTADPGPLANAPYLAKYEAMMRAFLPDTEAFAAIYNVAVRITPTRGRAAGA